MTNPTQSPARPLSRRRAGAVLLAAAPLLAGTLALAPAASASGSGAVTASGGCTGAPVWKLKAKPDDGGVLEVEFEVDTNHNGQRWTVRMRDNGTLFFDGTRTTQAPSGSFTVHRRTANRAGSDVITARAVRGDRVCRGSVTL